MTFPPPSPGGVISAGEAARRARMSTQALARWAGQGVLTPAVSSATRKRYSETEIALFVEVRALRVENEKLRHRCDDLVAAAARVAAAAARIQAVLRDAS